MNNDKKAAFSEETISAYRAAADKVCDIAEDLHSCWDGPAGDSIYIRAMQLHGRMNENGKRIMKWNGE